MSDQVSGTGRDDDWTELFATHVDEWSRRFADACATHQVDAVVVFAGSEKPRFRDDNEYPFYAEPYFKAWVPSSMPDAAVKITPGGKGLLVMVRDSGFWQAPPAEPEGFWTTHFSIKTVKSRAELVSELGPSGAAAIGEDETLQPVAQAVLEKHLPTNSLLPSTMLEPPKQMSDV